jgi:hypothetical protein
MTKEERISACKKEIDDHFKDPKEPIQVSNLVEKYELTADEVARLFDPYILGI